MSKPTGVTVPDEVLKSNLTSRKSPKWLFYLIQMLQSFGQNLSYQYFPIYSRKLGASETQMGLLTAVQNVATTLFQPIWGKTSDRIGRRIFLIIGFFVAGFAATLLAFVRTPVEAILVIGINGLGLSIVAPAWAGAIADYTDESHRGEFIGNLVSVGSAYVTIAFLVVAYLAYQSSFSELKQFRAIILVSGLNLLLAFLLSFFLIDINKKPEGNGLGIFAPLHDSLFRKFLIVILLWWLSMSFAWSYFPIVMNDIVEANAWQIALLSIVATAVQAYVALKWGAVTDRIGARRATMIGLSLFSIVPIGFAFATEWWHLIFAQLIAGFAIGAGFAALQAYILNIAGEENAGYYFGTYQILWGFVTFGGSFVGGVTLDFLASRIGLASAVTYMLLLIAGFRFITTYLFSYLPDSRNGK